MGVCNYLSPLGFSQSPALLGTITQLNGLAPFVPSDKQPSPPLPATIQLELGFVSSEQGYRLCALLSCLCKDCQHSQLIKPAVLLFAFSCSQTDAETS